MVNAALLQSRYVGMNIPTPVQGVWAAVRVNNWTGNAFQITRASDSATLDIGFLVNGAADWATADSFGRGTTYKINKLYDQSGNGYDMTSSGQSPVQFTNSINGIRTITMGGGSANQHLENTSIPITDFRTSTAMFAGTQTFGQFSGAMFEIGNPTNHAWMGCTSGTGAVDQATLGVMYPTSPTVTLRVGHGASNRITTINDLSFSAAGNTAVASTGATLGNAFAATTPGRTEMVCFALYDSALSAAAQTQLTDAAYGAMHINRSVLGDVLTFAGDSITFGTPNTGGAGNYAGCWAFLTAAQLGRPMVNYNIGISGQTAATCAGQTAFPAKTFRSGKFNVVCIAYGTNDLGANATAATTYTNLQTIASQYKSAGFNKVIIGTVMPRNTLFTAGQTHAGYEAARLALNTSIRAGIGTDFDVLADVGADAIMGNDANINNVTYFQDALHPTLAGNALMAPYWVNALLAVL
jgi:hypothetical protein